jgi:pyridoxal phosphate enzyme (YggS family)
VSEHVPQAVDGGHGQPDDDRSAELADNLARVQRRIARACAGAGRDPREVTVVAITKTWPAQDVRLLAALGLREMGENRDQEARAKAEACADLDLVWHFVGQLQRNKARSVARYADVVESVDRLPLVDALDRAAAQAQRRLGVCLQVDLDDEERRERGGARPADMPPLARAVEEAAELDLLGVMAVAPRQMEPARAFDRLAAVHERLLADHPAATMRSAGMSGDLAEAISAGATHVRLGSALLGRRDPLK